ncbi:hypothetical protein DY000_02054506 [Brassica cretica]|uniref:Putative plant transposon protein domain-containing protein n=1 Tax=Brassica cretica TaxID=69181 RepID=A0ABQ7AKH4_BRACR|nr:hypothetical protein DY000_02054506 [Brassica cretica]
MVRTKKMAKRDIVMTSWTHAEGESSRPHLTNEGSEATPPRNDLLSTALFLEITEELDEFNTVREKELSEESNDQHTSSIHEEVQIDKVTATSSDPASPKPLSAPIETVPSESPRSVEKTHEDAQNAGVVSLGSSSTEISEKQGRKKRVMKRLGLGSSKRRKTCKSGALNAASGSQVIPLNTSVSSLVRSRKAPERGTVGEKSPVKKRVEQFLRWSIIVERLVDMTEKDHAEFYASLLITKVEADVEEVEVRVCGQFYRFSPTMINEVLKLEPLDEDEVDEDVEKASMILESWWLFKKRSFSNMVVTHEEEAAKTQLVSIKEDLVVRALDHNKKSELAEFLTEETRKEWENLTTVDLSPRYGALMIIAAHNRIPCTHKTHVSIDRARLVYKMSRGIRVDMGRLIFKQVINLGVVQKNDSRWLIFPRLIMSILQKQHHVSLLSGEKAQGPVAYTKDKRFGEIYEQRVAKAKSKAKEVGEGKMSSRSTRMPPPVPSPSIAPASSNRTGPRRFIVHDLGSVSIPQGLLTQEDLQAVLQQTTRALQALTDIVQDLSRSVAGTCETRGLKKGRLKMYGQDGAVVVHETRHELRHQTKIQELFEWVKEH